jgi:hypothetical protein
MVVWASECAAVTSADMTRGDEFFLSGKVATGRWLDVSQLTSRRRRPSQLGL